MLANFLIGQFACIQLPGDLTVLLQLLHFYFAHLVFLWVDSRMSFLPKYVVRCVAVNFAFRDWHCQKTTGQFTIQVVAKLKRESPCRFASNSFMTCLRTQVFCCLGKCLVGFWKGYFNQKSCRRRNITIRIRLEEYRFCTLFSKLIKTVRKLNYLLFSKLETLFDHGLLLAKCQNDAGSVL
jgi:hypothetical protein